MSEEQAPRPRIPAGVPALYADHIGDAVYGFHTTKLVLTIEQGVLDAGGLALMENMRPVAVLTMPTPLLLAAAMKIVQDLTSQPIIDETAGRYRTILVQMKAVGALVRQANEMPQSSGEGTPPPIGGQAGGAK